MKYSIFPITFAYIPLIPVQISSIHQAISPVLVIIGNFKYISLQMVKLRSSILSHIIGWLIFLSLPLLFISGRSNNESILSILFSTKYLLFFLPYLFLFYFNTYFLIPQFYVQKKFFVYFIIIVLLLIIFYLLRPFDQLIAREMRPPQFDMHNPPPPGPYENIHGFHPPPPNDRMPRRIDAVSIFLFIMVWALSMAVQITRQWQIVEQRASRAEADKANAELSFLKAQINPHFLFNTLNNIYTLAVTKNEHTADSIMKLSNIMRYVTDDIAEDFVDLKDEINCIKDYIDLQKLRLGKNMNIIFEVTGELENKKIAPLILMTFVENVFKYGISNHEPADIIMKISSDKLSISFFSRNKIFATAMPQERQGVGIANAKKRLEYLYPDKYFLHIRKEDVFFEAQLTMQV